MKINFAINAIFVRIKLLTGSKILSESVQIQCDNNYKYARLESIQSNIRNEFYILFCTRDKFYSCSIVQNLITFLENEVLT